MEAIIGYLKSIKWKTILLIIGVKDISFFYWTIIADFLKYRKSVIVVRRMDALGDVICTIPLARQLRKNYPDSRLFFLTTPYCADILKSCDACDAISIVRIKHFKPSFNCFGIIRKVYEPLTQDERGLAVSRRHLYEVLAESCSVIVEDTKIVLKVSGVERTEIRERLKIKQARNSGKPVIVINCGPTWKVREWPADHWQELINRIHANYNVIIYQVGVRVAGKTNIYDTLMGTINLASGLTTKELISLIAESDILISIDSGPVHIASAVGTPVLSLLGALSHEISLPRDGISRAVKAPINCLGCHHSDPIGHWKSGCPNNIECMQKLTPNVVFDAFKSIADQILKKEHRLL
jgi:ADP-heptose:LPS heptosyltransferase